MKNRPLLIGVAAAVITIAIGVGLVLAVTSGDDNASGTAGPDAPRSQKSSTTSTSNGKSGGKSSSTSTTATTSKRAGTSTTAPTTTSTTTPLSTAPDSPDVDPNDAYQGILMPPGMSGAISACTWSPTNGGQLRASGTLTNIGNEDDYWLVSPVWLIQNGPQQEDIASETVLINEIPAGVTKPWNLTSIYPSPPPSLSCALEVE